jgi:hypothetical protein
MRKDFDGWTIKIGGWEVDFILNRVPQYRGWGYYVVYYDMIVYRDLCLYWFTVGWHNPKKYEL